MLYELFNHVRKESVTVKIANGTISYGEEQYTQYTLNAFVVSRDISVKSLSQGEISTSLVFYVDSETPIPTIPCEIIYDNGTYSANGVKKMVDMHGQFLCWRITVMV